MIKQYFQQKINYKIETLISKALTDSSNIHGEFISINNVLKIYEEIKKQNKNLTKKLCLMQLKNNNIK